MFPTYSGRMDLKRLRPIVMLLAVFFVAGACGDDSEQFSSSAVQPSATTMPPAVPFSPLTIDIDSSSRLIIQAPAGAVAKQGPNGPVVTAGDGFQLDLTPGTPSIEITKKDVQANMAVFKRFLAEDPVSLIWENEISGQKEYHLYVAVSALRGFACEDTKGTIFTEEQVLLMYRSCRTIAPAAVPR